MPLLVSLRATSYIAYWLERPVPGKRDCNICRESVISSETSCRTSDTAHGIFRVVARSSSLPSWQDWSNASCNAIDAGGDRKGFAGNEKLLFEFWNIGEVCELRPAQVDDKAL
jgi:hypothetical protein